MKQMNKLLKRYGTRKFEKLLASVKLNELLGGRDSDTDDDDILKWILIAVGAVVLVAAVVTLICTVVSKSGKKRKYMDEFDEFDEYDGSDEE